MVRKLKHYYQFIFILLFIFMCLTISTHSVFHEENNQNNEETPNSSVCFDWGRELDLFSESGGTDIEVDSEHNIYVLGYYYNETKKDFESILLKYDFEGILQWNKTLNYSVIGINPLAVDSSDNICIVGGIINNNNNDIQISKYNSSGELAWEKIWSTETSDFAYGVCFDENDNIYVVGSTEMSDVMGDIVVLKYNSSGILEWSTTWGYIDTDQAFDIKADNEGNLYFTGYSIIGETCNIILVKLNSSGGLQWNKTWGGSNLHIGYALTIDSLNNIFVTGLDQGVTGLHDLFICKVNSTGDLKWNYTYGGSGHHYGYSITLDSKEHILISGFSDGNILIVKLNQTGGKEWIKTWGGEFTELAYGIAIDESDNIFITGYSQQATDGDEFLLLVKFLPTPDNFELFSDAIDPDPVGNFTLTWSESIDANNYSLFQSNTSISDVNSSVIEVISHSTNRTYIFENLTEGTYYFMAVAFNEYGKTSSNCLEVKVQLPPEEFFLNNHTEIPDTDGIVNLSWSHSEGTKFYSVYVDDALINDIDIDQTLVVYNVTDRFYTIENLTNGDYYYAIVAINEAGEIMSNCIHVVIRRAPESFNLTSDAGNPHDDDGSFELIWTHSEYALNYSVYISNYSISMLNDSVIEIYNFTPSFEWPTYRYQLCDSSGAGLSNGTYYFIVVATNEYGEYTTECLEVVVKIPIEQSEEQGGNNIFKYFPQVVTYVALGSMLTGLIIIYNKRKKA